MGKIVGQTEFSSFGIATGLGEEKLWIQTKTQLLRNWPCHNLPKVEGLGKYIHPLRISVPGSNGIEGVFHTSQISRTEASLLGCL